MAVYYFYVRIAAKIYTIEPHINLHINMLYNFTVHNLLYIVYK